MSTRKRRLTLLIPLVGLVLSLAVGCAEDQNPIDDATGPRLPIVDRAIEFHGGDLFEASTTSLTVTSRSGRFDLVVARNSGEFDYTVSGKVGADQVERKVRYSNASVERWDNGEPVELDEEKAQRARNFVNARVYFPFLPYGLNGPEVYREDLGLDTWEGKELHKVRVTFQPGTSTDAEDRYMYWFDPDTGEMAMFGYDFNGGGGLRLRKVIRSQRVDGLLFSDQENYAINGRDFSVDQLTPQFVNENMKLLSTVAISNVKVTPLGSETSSADSLAPGAPPEEGPPGVVNYTRVDATVACAGATPPTAMAQLKELGFTSVINFRTAGERGATVEEGKAAAEAAGLEYFHIPFRSPSPEVVDEFLVTIADTSNQPVYIHCGSANRVGAMWFIKRVIQDGWEIDAAMAEAEGIGLRSEGLKEFALTFVQAGDV